MRYLPGKLACNFVDETQRIFQNPRGLPPPKEVRPMIQTDLHVHLLIYTFTLLVIQVRVARQNLPILA